MTGPILTQPEIDALLYEGLTAMNTPEVTALSARLGEIHAAYTGLTHITAWAELYAEELLEICDEMHGAIAERDERVRELTAILDALDVLKQQGGAASLKPMAVSGDDRDKLLWCLRRLNINPKRDYRDLVATIDDILAAGFRRPLESSQEVAKQHLADIAQELDMGYGLAASPAEPVKVAGREALADLKSGGVQGAVSKDDPLMIAWGQFQKSESYQNSRKWAAHEKHLDGSMWNCFMVGFRAASGILTGRKLDEVKLYTAIYLSIANGKYQGDVPLALLVQDVAKSLCADTTDIWTEE